MLIFIFYVKLLSVYKNSKCKVFASRAFWAFVWKSTKNQHNHSWKMYKRNRSVFNRTISRRSSDPCTWHPILMAYQFLQSFSKLPLCVCMCMYINHKFSPTMTVESIIGMLTLTCTNFCSFFVVFITNKPI